MLVLAFMSEKVILHISLVSTCFHSFELFCVYSLVPEEVGHNFHEIRNHAYYAMYSFC